MFGNYGLPRIESNGITSDGTTTTISFNPYEAIHYYGGFWVKIGLTLATGTDVVLFSTTGISNSTTPVYLSTGVLATTANFVSDGNGIHLCFYDRDNDRVLLIA